VLKDERFSAKKVRQWGKGAPDSVHNELELYNRELERWVPFNDPPVHTGLRARLVSAFGQQTVPWIRELAKTIVAEGLRDLAAAGEPDIIRDFAYPAPARVLAELLGITRSDIDKFKQWTVEIFSLIGAGVATEQSVLAGCRGVVELRKFVLELIRERKSKPREDVLSALSTSNVGGADISDDDIVGLVMTMIIAGHESTTHLIGNSLYGIFRDEKLRTWIKGQGGITEEQVEELARYDTPFFSIIRLAGTDLVLSGQMVRKGQPIFSMLNSGNRDPRVFRKADEIDFTRQARDHLGFGTGIHRCLGAMMARAVVKEAITQFLQRFPNASAELSQCAWLRNMSLRGLDRFPVKLH
jgi:cytochrome P450